MNFVLFGLTVWFWVILLLVIILVTYFLEDASDSDNSGGGTFSTVVFIGGIVAYYFLVSSEDISNLWNYIKTHPAGVIGYFVSYIIVGILWSVGKWYFFLKNKREYIVEIRKQQASYPHHNGHEVGSISIPQAKDHKAKILTWMHYWPVSAFWTLLNEPIKKLFRNLLSYLEGHYNRMASKVFAGVDEEILKFDKRKESENVGRRK
jgi:hypothetical protein